MTFLEAKERVRVSGRDKGRSEKEIQPTGNFILIPSHRAAAVFCIYVAFYCFTDDLLSYFIYE